MIVIANSNGETTLAFDEVEIVAAHSVEQYIVFYLKSGQYFKHEINDKSMISTIIDSIVNLKVNQVESITTHIDPNT